MIFHEYERAWIKIDPKKDMNKQSAGDTIDYGWIRVGSDARNALTARVVVQKLTKEQRQRREASLEKRRQKGKHTQSATQRSDIQLLVTNVTQEDMDPQDS